MYFFFLTHILFFFFFFIKKQITLSYYCNGSSQPPSPFLLLGSRLEFWHKRLLTSDEFSAALSIVRLYSWKGRFYLAWTSIQKHTAILKTNVTGHSCQCMLLKCLLTLQERRCECTIDSYKLTVKVDLQCIQDDWTHFSHGINTITALHQPSLHGLNMAMCFTLLRFKVSRRFVKL